MSVSNYSLCNDGIGGHGLVGGALNSGQLLLDCMFLHVTTLSYLFYFPLSFSSTGVKEPRGILEDLHYF